MLFRSQRMVVCTGLSCRDSARPITNEPRRRSVKESQASVQRACEALGRIPLDAKVLLQERVPRVGQLVRSAAEGLDNFVVLTGENLLRRLELLDVRLREGGGETGRPLEWSLDAKHMGRDFARDFGARLYKQREGYEGAFERMKADAD